MCSWSTSVLPIIFAVLTAGVSMFSNDPTVAARWVDAQLLSHKVTETTRVQVCATANDTVPGQTAQLPGHVGQDVNWREDDIGLRSTWHQLKPLSTKGRNVAPGMTYLGLRPLEGCSWGCTSWCWGWWTWRCWRSSGQGSGDSRPPADGLQRSQRPLWSLRSRCSLEKSHVMINLGKIPRSLGFYIPVKHSQGLFSPSLSRSKRPMLPVVSMIWLCLRCFWKMHPKTE